MWFVSRLRRIVDAMTAPTSLQPTTDQPTTGQPPTDQPPTEQPGDGRAGREHAADAPRLLETLSPSRASDFKHCPQLFKFKAIDQLEEPPTVHQARGTTAHLALQRLFDEPAPDRTPERLGDLFREAWMELKPLEYPDLFEDTAAERAWGIESLHVLANYFSIEDPTTMEPLERELDMREPLGEMTIRGILDRMEESAEGLVITDYKTGKAPPERYAIPAFFALKIYALLIRNRTGRTPVALKLMYLNGPTVYQIPVTDGQLDAMERQLEALWTAINRAIRTDNFPPRPGRLCDWCSFQEICPAFAVPSGAQG
jgi:putative RecB family exonuclease